MLVLDAVDAKSAAATVERAKQSDMPVIAYDRLISDADIDYYVSFDNVRQGRIQAPVAARQASARTAPASRS